MSKEGSLSTVRRCHYFRNDDGICWCEEGFIPSPRQDKSDCAYAGCNRRHEVKCLTAK